MPERRTIPCYAAIGTGLISLAVLSGCGDAAKTDGPKKKTVTTKSPTPQKSSDGGPAGKKKPRQSPESAADAVRAVLAGFHDKKPEAVWDFLPGSYQKDLNGIVSRFGEQMDPEMWSRFFGILRRIIKICRLRKTEIRDSAAVSRLGTNRKQLLVQWGATLELVETLVQSDVSDLKKLKTIELKGFLKATGGEFLRLLAGYSRILPGDHFQLEIDLLADIDVKLVSENEDKTTAVVELTLVKTGEQALRFSFVRVEDKWVPERMAATWKADIAAVRKQLDEELPRWLKENRQSVNAKFSLIEKSLTELDSAKDAAEFRKRFAGSPVAKIVVRVLRSGARISSDPVVTLPKGNGKTPVPKAGKTTVIVIVRGNLSDEAAETVADKLFALDKNVDVGDFVRANGTMRFPVSSVSDFEAFRKRIQFADIVSTDAAKREIVIRLK